MYAIREFAAVFSHEDTGVVVNMICPGLCSTGLARDSGTQYRALLKVLRVLFARTAEEGSRTILHAVVADDESHGKFLSACKVNE